MTKLMTIEGEDNVLMGEAKQFLRENPEVMGFIGTSTIMAIAARRLARRMARRGIKRIAKRVIANRLKRRARQW